MSSIVSALDKHLQPKQFGENDHVEYGWSEEPDQLVTEPVEEFDPQHGSRQGRLSYP